MHLDVLTDLLAVPARYLPARIAAGETTAEEITAAYLARITAVEPGIRAWCIIRPAKPSPRHGCGIPFRGAPCAASPSR